MGASEGVCVGGVDRVMEREVLGGCGREVSEKYSPLVGGWEGGCPWCWELLESDSGSRLGPGWGHGGGGEVNLLSQVELRGRVALC